MSLDGYARRAELYASVVDDDELASTRRKNLSGVVLYIAAIAIGLLLPGLAIAV